MHVLRDPITWLFVGAVLAAGLLSAAARYGIQLLYDQSVTDVFIAAQPSVTAVAKGMAVPIDAPGADVDVVRGFGDAAASGIEAFAPIVRTSRLRGTFLEDADAATVQEATAVEGELESLAAVSREHAGLALVAYRAARVLDRLSETRGRLTLDPVDQAHAGDLWTSAYARELRQMDADFQPTVDDIDRWRRDEVPTASATGQWDDERRRVEQFRGDVERMTDRVRSLPAPPGSVESGRSYQAALRHVDRALAGLDDYASKGSADPAPLLDVAAQLAAYRGERQQPLAAL